MELKRPFSDEQWQATPKPVRDYIVSLENTVDELVDTVNKLEKRIDKLESQLNRNSQNSSKPPSSDPPFKKRKKDQEKKSKQKKKKRKRGGQKGHRGHRQKLLKPGKTSLIEPGTCACGCTDFIKDTVQPFYTHQHIELPKIKMDISHLILQRGECERCGKTVKAKIPVELRAGYGPRLSALIAELSGSHGAGRETVQDFCRSVLGFHISTGAVQNVIDRASAALEPVYDGIGNLARTFPVNYIDETSWFQSSKLQWLWAMINEKVAFFKIHNNRSKEAFEALIDDWKGILVSDDYGTYKKWEHGRQTFLPKGQRPFPGFCAVSRAVRLPARLRRWQILRRSAGPWATLSVGADCGAYLRRGIVVEERRRSMSTDDGAAWSCRSVNKSPFARKGGG